MLHRSRDRGAVRARRRPAPARAAAPACRSRACPAPWPARRPARDGGRGSTGPPAAPRSAACSAARAGRRRSPSGPPSPRRPPSTGWRRRCGPRPGGRRAGGRRRPRRRRPAPARSRRPRGRPARGPARAARRWPRRSRSPGRRAARSACDGGGGPVGPGQDQPREDQRVAQPGAARSRPTTAKSLGSGWRTERTLGSAKKPWVAMWAQRARGNSRSSRGRAGLGALEPEQRSRAGQAAPPPRPRGPCPAGSFQPSPPGPRPRSVSARRRASRSVPVVAVLERAWGPGRNPRRRRPAGGRAVGRRPRRRRQPVEEERGVGDGGQGVLLQEHRPGPVAGQGRPGDGGQGSVGGDDHGRRAGREVPCQRLPDQPADDLGGGARLPAHDRAPARPAPPRRSAGPGPGPPAAPAGPWPARSRRSSGVRRSPFFPWTCGSCSRRVNAPGRGRRCRRGGPRSAGYAGSCARACSRANSGIAAASSRSSRSFSAVSCRSRWTRPGSSRPSAVASRSRASWRRTSRQASSVCRVAGSAPARSDQRGLAALEDAGDGGLVPPDPGIRRLGLVGQAAGDREQGMDRPGELAR